MTRWALPCALWICSSSCAPPPATSAPAPTGLARYLPAASGSLQSRLCTAPATDRVTRYFCSTPTPRPTSLAELERGLGLEPTTVSFALTANSTAVTMREVNPLNPRTILFDQVPRPYLSKTEFLALGFTRGEQVVELETRDEVSKQLRYFLVTFTQACNASGCSSRELLLPSLEEHWVDLDVRADTELADTVVDCLHCHEPQGPGTKRILRMQEFTAPWTHFLSAATESVSGAALLADFRTAHPRTETWAGLPGWRLDEGSDPALLSSLVAQESVDQPNAFPSFAVALELQAEGSSATWQRLADLAWNGGAIPVPYPGLRVTEPAALRAAAQAYASALAGGADEPIDPRTLLSPEAELAMSVRPRPGATGEQILVQLCQHCHDSKLDQTLSRARFDVEKLATLSADERAVAIGRLQRADDDPLKMPPVIFGTLDADEVQRVVRFLSP